MLDLVIGEFDDGLESEIEKGDETQIKRNLKNKQNSAINDKIDHIFNELTQEIYVEQRRERRQKSPTRNVFDPLPAPPLTKGVGRGREHANAEGVRGKAGLGDGEEGVKGRGKSRQEQERRGRQQHDRRKRADSCEDDRPPPGVVQAAKQSYLHKTKTPETRSEVVLYNEGQEDRGASSEKVKVDVHNHAAGAASESSAGVKRTKSPGVARPSPPSQVPAVATKEKAVIKELREKVEGKQGKISKFSQRGGNASAIGKEEKRKDPLGSDSSSAGQGRSGKPKRATSEAVRLESVAEEGRGQNRMRERRPEQRRGREERGQRSRSVGALEQERAREEAEEEQSRRLRRSKSRGSQDQLDEWGEVSDQQRRSRSRSKSISRSRGEILDVTASSKRQEATVRPVEGTRGGGQMGGQPFSRRQFLVQTANLQNNLPHPPPPAHHSGFLSP